MKTIDDIQKEGRKKAEILVLMHEIKDLIVETTYYAHARDVTSLKNVMKTIQKKTQEATTK